MDRQEYKNALADLLSEDPTRIVRGNRTFYDQCVRPEDRRDLKADADMVLAEVGVSE